jgi:mannose-6-phosphate isomerase-like protein (cupin superfamily)
MPFIHKHRENEEVYIIIKGLGQILLNDIVFEINEGSVIRVSPETERTIRNNSTSDLIFIVIQGKLNSIKSQQIDDGYSIEKQQKWQ